MLPNRIASIIESLRHALWGPGTPAPALADFLRRDTVKPDGVLPLIHTTPAYNLLRKLPNTHQLEATQCDVFKSDSLLYFLLAVRHTSTLPVAEKRSFTSCRAVSFLNFKP
jgi:hypothetical protein